MVIDEPLDILIVLAHPDDEALGQTGLILHAHAHNLRCGLLCATRGEVGEIRDSALGTPSTLGATRTIELQRAMSLVDLDWLELLPYRDSGMAGSAANDDPRALIRADPEDIVGHIVRVIRLTRPTSVITFGADGVYGHPDHVFIGAMTDEAFGQAGQGQPFLGEPWRATSLYHVAIPREGVLMSMRNPRSPFHQMPREIAETFGIPAASITHWLDTEPWIDRKIAVALTHATQMAPDHPLLDRSNAETRRWLSRERWTLFSTIDNPDDTRPDPVHTLCARYPGKHVNDTDRPAL